MTGNLMQLDQILQKGKVWTVSNIISFFRIVFALVLYYLILQQYVMGSLLLAILSIISDYADGYFARKRNEISELGKILDPLGDKVMVGLASVALYQSFGLPLWVVIVIIGRDILIVLGSLILMPRIKQITASAFPGKIAVTIIALLLLAYLLKIQILYLPLQILTIIIICFSFLYYFIRFIKVYMNNSIQ